MSDRHEYEIFALYFSLYIEIEYHMRKSLWGHETNFLRAKVKKAVDTICMYIKGEYIR